jgi:hypothetical protein
MVHAGFGGACDEEDKGPGSLAAEFCAQYPGSAAGTPSFWELGAFLGPSVLIMAGLVVALVTRGRLHNDGFGRAVAVVTSLLAIAWGIGSWTPVITR